MSSGSAALLERFRLAHGKDIDLTLRGPYADLLARFGNPQDKLPPTFIVAGTNGKGSTCAFLRALIEASGRKAHVYTSPHLVRFHERIRIAGELISEEELTDILTEAEKLAEPGAISLFEVATAAALVAFARHPADATILEVGLGGRLDATNIVEEPVASLIARLSFDHREYLGDTMGAIAREKAGIMRRRTPCFTAPQPSTEALLALREEAEKCGATLIVGGEDWRIEAVDEGHFRFLDATRKIENMPRPALLGTHQLWNAGLALAACAALPFEISDEAACAAMQNVSWPGRLEHLSAGPLPALLPQGWELWIDGGHNDSAGEVLGAQLRRWQAQDGRPLDIVYGMLSTKQPREFLGPMAPFIRRLRTVQIQGEVPGRAPEELAAEARACGIKDAAAAAGIQEAIQDLVQKASQEASPARILGCGSLYLVGATMKLNQSVA